ncbi:MAG TPA: outer membrane beta-barrel protein [Gammaproteobacteria bacterium]
MNRLALLAFLGLAQLAHAQGEGGGYIGAGFGTFDYEEEVGTRVVSDSTPAYQIIGGYRFNDYFAVEANIGRTGDLEDDFEATIPGLGTLGLEVDLTYDIYAAKIIGSLPLDRFKLFAGVGYYSADASGTVSVSGFGEVDFFDAHERGSTATLGVQYDFGLDLRNFSIRGEYQWYDFDEADASAVNIGMVYRF